MNVSVIVPTFNHAEFVAEAINSIAGSIFVNPEIIVVNDGSTDNTKELIHRDPRIRYFEQENQGAHAALNFGISQASHEVIAILNDDDIYKPEHLVRAVLQMQTCGTDIVIGGAEPFGEGPLLEWVTNHILLCDQRIRDFGVIETLTELNFAISTSSMVFRKEVFTQGEGFLKLSLCHDHEFLLRSILKYEASVHFSQDPTWKYRVHQTNSSSRIKKLSSLAERYFALFSNLVWAPQELRRHVEIFRFLPGMNTEKMIEIQKILNSHDQNLDPNSCLSKIEEYITENRMMTLQS